MSEEINIFFLSSDFRGFFSVWYQFSNLFKESSVKENFSNPYGTLLCEIHITEGKVNLKQNILK